MVDRGSRAGSKAALVALAGLVPAGGCGLLLGIDDVEVGEGAGGAAASTSSGDSTSSTGGPASSSASEGSGGGATTTITTSTQGSGGDPGSGAGGTTGAGGEGGATGTGGDGGGGGVVEPTCSDGIQNQGESDADCGGPCADNPFNQLCALGRSCEAEADCVLAGDCKGGVCVPEPIAVFTPAVGHDFVADPDTAWFSAFGVGWDPIGLRTILVGGQVPFGGVQALTFVYDPADKSWDELDVAADPAPNANFGLAWAGDEFVMFGGGALSPYPWTWDTNLSPGWVHRTDADGLPPGTEHVNVAMAYDALMDEALVFGGAYAGGPNDEFFAWSDGSWIPQTVEDRPPARTAARMAYDPSRQVTVLFGGATSGEANAALDDTWEWDGAAWTEIEDLDVSPQARTGFALAFDPVRSVLVLVSGGAYDGNVIRYDDVWEYDGVWRRIDQLAGSPLVGSAYWNEMVYDTARSRFVYVKEGDPPMTQELYFLATACAGDSDCGSGICVDGLCCEEGCGTCEACNTEANPGRCEPISSMEDPDSCAGDMTCDDQGECVER